MSEKVICLGKEFNSEEERREHFRNELRTKLPELKKMEGFPIGEDDAIINLSDPPYYTACPNPWLNDFVAEWEKEKANIPRRKNDFHVKEPYASDVIEGKNNPIYNAHSYHTKVPHPAIMRYILHYTQPGDIVLDGFAGTGMTAIASQLCDKPDPALKLVIENERRNQNLTIPVWGSRQAIINDLSPIASFIGYNYNSPFDIELFEKEARLILGELESELGWMYETRHHNGKMGRINFTVWSEVYSCPSCAGEVVFMEEALDEKTKRVNENFSCPHCNAELTKKSLDKLFESNFDEVTSKVLRTPKRKPVLINYQLGDNRFEKKPDDADLQLLDKIAASPLPVNFPIMEIPPMHMTHERARMDYIGITSVHNFYLARPLNAISTLWSKVSSQDDSRIRNILFFLIEQSIWGLSLLNRYGPLHFSQVNRYLNGVYYVASQHAECSPWYILDGKLNRLIKTFNSVNLSYNSSITTGSAFNLPLKEDQIDYIFTDPPFGENIYYSDLNFLIESWHRILTNSKSEAIVDRFKKKGLPEYHSLMRSCFEEYYRVLKPNGWMTVVFSNSSAAVWNAIQSALQQAGFVLANVSAMDKQQGSYRQVTSTTAVKQDLIITCYKPSSKFTESFKTKNAEVAVWDFVREHLLHLPVHLIKTNSTTAIVERSAKILYDRLITFYLMNGLQVPLDATDFQAGLRQRYSERDGMYFLGQQALEYDEKKSISPNVIQLSLLVSNENEGIEWLRQELKAKPQTYQDLHPQWLKAISDVRKGDILPELKEILKESFIQDADGSWRAPDTNEAKDREAMRTRVLLKEFNGYVTAINQPRAKKLKEVRVEALRAGFKNCWELKDFKTIVTLGEMIPQNILLEDEQLLMYYDIAKDRI
jgi:DNA modification methylase